MSAEAELVRSHDDRTHARSVEWTATATRPDGRRVEWDGVDVVVLRDGRVCGNYVYSSSHAARTLDG